MLGGYHDAPVPLVDRHRDQLRILGYRLGCDAEIGLTGKYLLTDLGPISLMDDQLDLRVAPLERGNRLTQRVTRLRVGCCDAQRAELVGGQLLARPFEV